MYFPNPGFPNFHTQETFASLQEWAKTQPVNNSYFIQIRDFPACGMWIRYDSDKKLHVNMVNVDKFVDYPDDVSKLGFRWYIQEIMRSPQAAPGVTKPHFTNTLDQCIEAVNEAIRKDHGIECLLKGDESTPNPRNKVILHFCDVLVIVMRQNANKDPPQVLIKSSQLETIDPAFKESFFCTLTSEQKYFILMNADLMYHIYALWGNYSHKPIRIENRDIVGLSRSERMTNDIFFRKHQEGKYNAMKRKAHSTECKLYYMVD